jgi:hypothetical protein
MERDWTMTKGVLAWLGLTMMAVAAAAQTTVTTSGGTTNTVPVFTGSATVGNSPITVSGSNVGIGTTAPATALDVVGGIRAITGAWSVASTGAGIEIDSRTGGNGYITSYNRGSSAYQPLYLEASTIMLNGAGQGSVGIGTTSPGANAPSGVTGTFLEVKGNIMLTQQSGGSLVFADGSIQNKAWNGVLNGGDYAEDMRATGMKEKYEPGDVLVLAEGDNADVQESAEPYSAMVAGIYATKPGVVGRREAVAKSADNVPMAMVGVVPTKVSAENGPIRKGDLLVSASLPGYAMKGTDRSRMLGAVLGKAMGSLDSGTGVIEVLVTLQ